MQNQQTNYQKQKWIEDNPFSYLGKTITQIPIIPQNQKITSIRDVYGQILTKLNYRDNLQNDVWIGKKPLSKNPIQISIQGFVNSDHWVCMVQGKIYSLTTDNGWINGKIVIEVIANDQKDKYDWSYFGQCYRDMEHIDIYVQYINSLKIQYKMIRTTNRNLWDNCQFYAVQIAKFASSIGHENEIFLSGQNLLELERNNYKNINERSVLDFMKNKNIITFPQFRKMMNKDYLIYRDSKVRIKDVIQEKDPYDFKIYDQFQQDPFRANMIISEQIKQ